jgi:hypothetical protein
MIIRDQHTKLFFKNDKYVHINIYTKIYTLYHQSVRILLEFQREAII